MSIHQQITAGIQETQRTAIDDVNRWRGHCLERFARIEQALARWLAPYGKVPPALAAKIAAAKAHIEPKSRLSKSLERLAQLSEHRNLIVHACGSVWIDDRGQWLWAFRFTPSGKDKGEQAGQWFKGEAHDFEQNLAKTVRSICDQLTTAQRTHAAVSKGQNQ